MSPSLTAPLLAVLALGAVLLTGCGGQDDPAASKSTVAAGGLERLGTGQDLPDATLPYLDRSGSLDTETLRGTPAVVNFWATWCAFCVEEMPDLEAVHRELGDRVRFVGVDREDNHERARKLAEKTGVTYDLVTDDDASFFHAVQGRGMPTTVLVTAEGRIVYRHAGPLTASELRDLLLEHLGVEAS